LSDLSVPPILDHKNHDSPSVFTAENMLREARRQKNIPYGQIPKICLLDPDGDLVLHLRSTGQAQLKPFWACYHTQLFDFTYDGIQFGLVGCAVGASFAVLVAEEMFASGCELLISITSAGQIVKVAEPPYFFVIERALRDEGTSYHYLPPSNYSEMNPATRKSLEQAFKSFGTV
jgi:uridine phosphorylase